MKLWDKKGSDINTQIEKFTVGRDPEFDMVLARYDVQGSIAHVKMLESVKMLSP
jgi:argininosuccinate lyase